MADVDSLRVQLDQPEVRQSSVRQTPDTSFGMMFKRGLNSTAQVVGNTASAAGYAVPGAAVVGAAITGVGTVRDTSAGVSSVAPNSTGLTASTGNYGGSVGSTGTTGGVVGTSGVASSQGNYLGDVALQASSGSSSAQLMMATEQMQEMNQTFNLQYLQLQENMQAESRQFTALSNVMKTKSDTAKNSLSNLK